MQQLYQERATLDARGAAQHHNVPVAVQNHLLSAQTAKSSHTGLCPLVPGKLHQCEEIARQQDTTADLMEVPLRTAQVAEVQAAQRAPQQAVIHAAEQAAQQMLQAASRGTKGLLQQRQTKPFVMRASNSEGGISLSGGGFQTASDLEDNPYIAIRIEAEQQIGCHGFSSHKLRRTLFNITGQIFCRSF